MSLIFLFLSKNRRKYKMKPLLRSYKEQYNLKEILIARIIGENRLNYHLESEIGVHFVAKSSTQSVYYVGDYVQLVEVDKRFYIVKVFERKNSIHKARNETTKSFHQASDEKILATNVDRVYIALAADQRFTLGKLERYLLVFNQAHVDLEVLITKSDKIEKAQTIQMIIEKHYPMITVRLLSILDHSIETFKQTIPEQSTSIILGSSGVGKSTLINYLSSNLQLRTNNVRDDGKGKHTTTDTSLIYLSTTNSYFIDTPGFKAIDTTQTYHLDGLFDDILERATHCKFNDCRHQSELGCAVKEAIQLGQISQEKIGRYHHYVDKQKRTERYLKLKQLRDNKK